MGEKQRGLVEFRRFHVCDLAQQDGERDRDNNPQYNKNDIEAQGIADDLPGVLAAEEEFKIFQSHPFASQQVGDKAS